MMDMFFFLRSQEKCLHYSVKSEKKQQGPHDVIR